MRLSRNAVFALLFTAGLALVSMDAAAQVAGQNQSSNAGSSVLGALQGAITGNIGLILGLGLAILGIWTWVVKQETAAGIMLIIGGVLITISPGVFNSIRGMVDGIVATTSGGAGNLTTTQRAGGVN